MICLICIPSALGLVALGLWAYLYISGESFMPMLQLLPVVTSTSYISTLKTSQYFLYARTLFHSQFSFANKILHVCSYS